MSEHRRRIDTVLEPSYLADEGPRAPVEKSRVNRRLAPSMDIQWRRGREHLITDGTLATPPNLDDDELRSHRRRAARPAQGRPGVSAPGE